MPKKVSISSLETISGLVPELRGVNPLRFGVGDFEVTISDAGIPTCSCGEPKCIHIAAVLKGINSESVINAYREMTGTKKRDDTIANELLELAGIAMMIYEHTGVPLRMKEIGYGPIDAFGGIAEPGMTLLIGKNGVGKTLVAANILKSAADSGYLSYLLDIEGKIPNDFYESLYKSSVIILKPENFTLKQVKNLIEGLRESLNLANRDTMVVLDGLHSVYAVELQAVGGHMGKGAPEIRATFAQIIKILNSMISQKSEKRIKTDIIATVREPRMAMPFSYSGGAVFQHAAAVEYRLSRFFERGGARSDIFMLTCLRGLPESERKGVIFKLNGEVLKEFDLSQLNDIISDYEKKGYLHSDLLLLKSPEKEVSVEA